MSEDTSLPETAQPAAEPAKHPLVPEAAQAAAARMAEAGDRAAADGVDPETGLRVPSNLCDVLTLDTDRGADPNRFVGFNTPTILKRTFGGQVLGQALMAACRTIAEGADGQLEQAEDDLRVPHSLHAYFLRGGDPKLPIAFEVERLRDGRSFSARRVHALQEGKAILAMIASFQEPAEGLEHQDTMPEVPAAETLPTLSERYPHIPPHWNWVGNRSVDIRHVQQPLYLEADPERARVQQVWVRCLDQLPDSQLWHASVLAYLSDFNLLEPVLRNHGVAWVQPGLKAASLDHAMWFHRPFRADQWLLYSMESPSASGARGLARGQIFTQDGTLVASVTQEGMLRV